MVYVALLRGINVGGNTRVEMARLREVLAELGYTNVSTYINSGNAFFESLDTDHRQIELKIEKAITQEFGHTLHVVIRNLVDIEKIINKLPSDWHNAVDKKCNVIFLRHNIDNRDILNDLNPKEGIEEIYYYQGVLLWSANTSDLTKSEMIKLAKSPLYKDMTVRNLNTTKKIYEIMKNMS